MTLVSRVRYWLLPIPLLGLLGLSYWLNQQALMEPAKPDSSKRHDPDAIVENFSATRLNTQGTPHFVMTAKKMLHFPDDDSTTLESPRLTSLSPGRSAIHAKANIGNISSDGEAVFLHGNVEILREAGTQQGALTLNTNFLRVIPDAELMDTDQKVTVAETHNTIHATGLKMDNKARTIQLLSQVRSEYVPPKQ